MKKHALLLSIVLIFSGLRCSDLNRCDEKCKGSNESCMFLFSMLMSSSDYPTYYTTPASTTVSTEHNDLANGFFNSAELIYTPSYDTIRFNAVTDVPDDVDIYYLESLYNTSQFSIKQVTGTATCEMYKSSVPSSTTNSTDIPDLFMVNTGSVTTLGTDITLDASYPYLYIRCTDTIQSTYSFELTPNGTNDYYYPDYSYDSSSMLPFIMLLCSGSEESCVDSCLSGD